MENKIKIILILSFNIFFAQSDQDIKNIQEYVQKSGMSKAEAIKAAKARGASDVQIDNVLKKSEKTKSIKKNESFISDEDVNLPKPEISNKVNYNENEVDGDLLKEKPNEIELEKEIVSESLKSKKSNNISETSLKYYGYDIFKKNPALFQASTIGLVDPNYLIGPGDEIIVMLWGETQFRQVLKVDREGFFFIPEIGQVFVNGLNLSMLESKLFKVFSRSYASLNPQGREPTTFLDVSLGDLRPLRVQVLGEISQPGAYTVSPSTTLFSSLYYFKGPTTLGSLRDIKLIRGDKEIASIDFYDYLLTGKKIEDQKLQLDDIIFIPPRLKTVKVKGEINRNGIYELKNGENLSDLIKMAGGLKITAYIKRAQIDRIVPFEERNKVGMDRQIIDVNLKESLNSEDRFELKDGDVLTIFPILSSRSNIVSIEGAITRPGKYDIGDSLKLSQLIQKTDGLLGDAYQDKVDIIRTNLDLTEALIELNLTEVLNEDSQSDIYLKGGDKIKIYSKNEMMPKQYVLIQGHVKKPGRYSLQENMTLYDLIFVAGGFLDLKFKQNTFLDRANLIRYNPEIERKKIISFNLGEVLEKKDISNMQLQPDDVVEIYSLKKIKGEERYVSISGEVKFPGNYELYEDNMRIKDLLFMAGGFTDPIFLSKIYLKRADLIRISEDGFSKKIFPFSIEKLLNDSESAQNMVLLSGDEIKVYSQKLFNSIGKVTIDGFIRKSGEYELKNEMTLKDIIIEAGGLKSNIYRARAEIARIDPLNKDLNSYANVISFNFSLESLTKKVDNQNIELTDSINMKLSPYDLIYIRADPYFSKQKNVIIKGGVLYPGKYVILNSEEKITDLIERAGGLLENAYPEATKYMRKGLKINISLEKIMKKPRSDLNYIIQDGDEIEIFFRPNAISIMGEVNNPGIHKYVKGQKVKYYLNLAGGLGPDSDKKNIWVEFPNGDSKEYKNSIIFNPKIIDGSTIVVGKKKEEEPFDRTEFAKEVTSIIANLAQTLTLLFIAR